MYTLIVPAKESFNEDTFTFEKTKGFTLQLRHSLISVSKWESIYKRPFFDPRTKRTEEELRGYIRCMLVGQTITDEELLSLDEKSLKEVDNYINDPKTATWFPEQKGRNEAKGNVNGEIVTTELIYYWMIQNGIPFECEKWNLNRLLTLIQVCNRKNAKKEGMSQKDVLAQNAALNKARRAKYH